MALARGESGPQTPATGRRPQRLGARAAWRRIPLPPARPAPIAAVAPVQAASAASRECYAAVFCAGMCACEVVAQHPAHHQHTLQAGGRLGAWPQRPAPLSRTGPLSAPFVRSNAAMPCPVPLRREAAPCAGRAAGLQPRSAAPPRRRGRNARRHCARRLSVWYHLDDFSDPLDCQAPFTRVTPPSPPPAHVILTTQLEPSVTVNGMHTRAR